jgi:hypothetical protein
MSALDQDNEIPPQGSGGKIAYLTGEYPKVSHTFIQREVVALRGHGANVVTCTVRRANPKDVVGPDQKVEEKTTFCILAAARAPQRRQMRPDQPLRLAIRTRPPGFKALLYQLFYFAEAGVLARHLRRENVVHLHNHFGNSSCSVAMLTSEMSGIPFSFTEHGPAIFFEPMHWRIDEKVAFLPVTTDAVFRSTPLAQNPHRALRRPARPLRSYIARGIGKTGTVRRTAGCGQGRPVAAGCICHHQIQSSRCPADGRR